MQIYNIVFLRNQALNTNFNSIPLELANMFGYSIQIEWSGTANGAFKLQGSTDSSLSQNHQGTWPVNWTDIDDSSSTVTTGSTGYNVTDVMYNWVRVVYTDASGGTSTAVLTTATFNGKGQ